MARQEAQESAAKANYLEAEVSMLHVSKACSKVQGSSV